MDKTVDQTSRSSDLNDQFDFHKRGDRIEFALRHAGINESQAAQILNFAQSSLNNYRHNRTKRFLRLADLASYLGVNAVWLHSGEGSPFQGTGKDPIKSQYYAVKMNQKFFDNHFSKQYPDKNLEDLAIQISVSDLHKLNSTDLSYVLMPDDSMANEIKYSSTVIIDENDVYIENAKLYAVCTYDNVNIRRIYQVNKTVTLKANNNSAYEDHQLDRALIDSSGFDVLGKVKLVKNYYN